MPVDQPGRGFAAVPPPPSLTSQPAWPSVHDAAGPLRHDHAQELDGYRVVQDTHFSLGGASGGTGRAGTAAPVETHVHLETPEDDDFARAVVDMGEQTCFLHALCRTGLTTKVNVATE